MSKILSLHARQIFDSRGNPTVECDCTTTDGLFRAAVPSGSSTGIYEGDSFLMQHGTALPMHSIFPKIYQLAQMTE